MFCRNSSILVIFLSCFWTIMEASPVVIKGSSPLGDTIVAISSSDPDVEKYLSLNIQPPETRSGLVMNPEPVYSHGISLATPGHAAAGTGRGFVSTSSYNPFFFPLFNLPLNLEGLGLSNMDLPNTWFRGLENYYEPSIGGNGEIKTVTAVNDNGHVYGKVNTVTFDNRAKGSQTTELVN